MRGTGEELKAQLVLALNRRGEVERGGSTGGSAHASSGAATVGVAGEVAGHGRWREGRQRMRRRTPHLMRAAERTGRGRSGQARAAQNARTRARRRAATGGARKKTRGRRRTGEGVADGWGRLVSGDERRRRAGAGWREEVGQRKRAKREKRERAERKIRPKSRRGI